MIMEPTNTYGYILISTPEDLDRYEPKREGDEYWDDCDADEVCKPEHWDKVLNPSLGFVVDTIYRRKISPGPDHEIVGAEEVPQITDEYTRDGLGWNYWGNLPDGICKAYANRDNPILAFRRRKQPMKEPTSEKTVFQKEYEQEIAEQPSPEYKEFVCDNNCGYSEVAKEHFYTCPKCTYRHEQFKPTPAPTPEEALEKAFETFCNERGISNDYPYFELVRLSHRAGYELGSKPKGQP